jgi:hypothetical protein
MNAQHRVDIGVRWNPEGGHEFFGIAEANQLLAEGFRVVALGEPKIIMAKHHQDDEVMGLYYAWCSVPAQLAAGEVNEE